MLTCAVLALGWRGLTGAGEIPAGDPLTPSLAVDLAIAHHPLIRAGDSEVAAAKADVALARSGYLPRIDLSEEVFRSTNPTFVFASKLGQERFGPLDFGLDVLNAPDPFTNAATRISLSQSLWDAGRTFLGGKAASAGLLASSLSRDRTQDQIAFAALRAFWDAVLAEEMLDVARTAQEAAAANARMAATREESGLAVPSDRMSADVRLSEVRVMVIRSSHAVTLSRAALRQALGAQEDHPWTLVPSRFDDVASCDSAEPSLDESLDRRPDMLALDARLEQARLGERLARSGYLPVLGAGAHYEWNDSSPFGTHASNWTVGLSLRVALFDGLEGSARLARARADRGRLEALRSAAGEGIRVELSAAHSARISACEQMLASRPAVRLADEAHRIVRERYDEGMAVIVELLGAEASAADARGRALLAEHDFALADAALELASGRMTARADGVGR